MRKQMIVFGCCLCFAGTAEGQPSGAPAVEIPDLHLACEGTGTYPVDDGTRSAATEVFLDVFNKVGRIKVPRVEVDFATVPDLADLA